MSTLNQLLSNLKLVELIDPIQDYEKLSDAIYKIMYKSLQDDYYKILFNKHIYTSISFILHNYVISNTITYKQQTQYTELKTQPECHTTLLKFINSYILDRTTNSDCIVFTSEYRSFNNITITITIQLSSISSECRISTPLLSEPIYNDAYKSIILELQKSPFYTIKFNDTVMLINQAFINDYMSLVADDDNDITIKKEYPTNQPGIDDIILLTCIPKSTYFKDQRQRPRACFVIENSYGFISKHIDNHYNASVEINTTTTLKSTKYVPITCLVDSAIIQSYINSVYFGKTFDLTVMYNPKKEYINYDVFQPDSLLDLYVYNAANCVPGIGDKYPNHQISFINHIINAITTSKKSTTLILLISSIILKNEFLHKLITKVINDTEVTTTLLGQYECLFENNKYLDVNNEISKLTEYTYPGYLSESTPINSIQLGLSNTPRTQGEYSSPAVQKLLQTEPGRYKFQYLYCIEFTKNINIIKKE